MAIPKMIIFDVGRTLVDYASIDTLRGVKAFMPYITSNPRQLNAEQIDEYTNEVFELFEASRKQLFEVPEQTILTLVYDLLGLRFSISLEEVERTIWSEDSVKVPSKNVAELLDYLSKIGIRTAIISNIDFSGNLLRAMIDELFPNHQFEFIIASSDYGIRKPNPYIFEAGITKSGLEAKDIWYVGDKISVDVEGSKRAGMIPVLYKCPRNKYPELPNDLLVIDDFLDLIRLIDKP